MCYDRLNNWGMSWLCRGEIWLVSYKQSIDAGHKGLRSRCVDTVTWFTCIETNSIQSFQRTRNNLERVRSRLLRWVINRRSGVYILILYQDFTASFH